MNWLRGLVVAGAVVVAASGLGCTTAPSAQEKTGSARQAQVVGGAAVTTDFTNYATDQTVNVTWSGLPGASHDWIALSQFGSGATSFVTYVYTYGATDGTVAFSGPSVGGDYEARAYSDDTYTVLATSAKITVASTATSVTTNANYPSLSPVTVTFAGLPGNATDWLALATVGAANESFASWKYTGGLKSGMIDLDGVPAGSYVARAFENNSYTLLKESAPFTVGVGETTLTTNPTYPAFAPVTITFGGLPGNATDWIAIATPGALPTSFVTYKYTSGLQSGTIDLQGVPAGNYVARAFENNTYTLLKESAQFTVAAAATTLTTDKTSYTPAESASVSFTGMSGSATDWVAIALEGSDIHQFISWQYTGGGTSGSKTFALTGLGGSYVARAFADNSYTLAKESAAFTVGAAVLPITTDSNTYTTGMPITISFNGLPGNSHDWIAISVLGSLDASFVAYNYTYGAVNGSVVLNGIPAGTYEARAYENDTYNVLHRSASFTVTAGMAGTTISTTANTYTEAQTITVNYAGMSGAATDWISIATEGSAADQFVLWVYTNGAASGTATFSAAGLSAGGPYVARAYFNDSFTVEATSTPAFNVTP